MSAARGRCRSARWWRCSCRCRGAHSAAGHRPRGARPARAWRASSGPPGRTPHARRRAPSARAQVILFSSSKRAFSSTSTVTCLSCSRARISALTIGEFAANPIERLLDRQHIGVFGGGLNQRRQVAGMSRTGGAAGYPAGGWRRTSRRCCAHGGAAAAQLGRMARLSDPAGRSSSGHQVGEAQRTLNLVQIIRCDLQVRPSAGRACAGGISCWIVRRTTAPKRRWRTPSSIVRSRSAASSSWISISASRVTRNG